MNLTNKKKKNGFITVSSLVLLCTLMLYLFIGIRNIPDNISVKVGEENDLKLTAPFSLNIEKQSDFNVESITVMNSDDSELDIYTGFKNDVDISYNDDILTINSQDAQTVEASLSIFGIPFKKISIDVMPEVEVVPCGNTVGVKIYTNGVMVLGNGTVTGIDGNSYRPAENKLKSGDTIVEINNTVLQGKKDLENIIHQSNSEEELLLKVQRDDEFIDVYIKPVVSNMDNNNKIGVWVRETTQGIGTLTYYNPKTKAFGALGHGILDVDTKKLISVKKGTLMSSEIISVKKGKKGIPGELVGEIRQNKEFGDIKINSMHGLYGTINNNLNELPQETKKVGFQSEIHEGPAKIISNVNGKETKEYDVYIESVNKYSNDDSKGMIVMITDRELLTKTNGIVQGMSGSPIIQDDKLIGAVTHVFVQNPSKGYGIFIENMMKNEVKS